MKTSISFLLFTLFIIGSSIAFKSCNNGNNAHLKEKWLIDSLKAEGFNLKSNCNLPYGISESELSGITDRKNGVFHRKELKLKSCSIESYCFTNSATPYPDLIHYYKFEFTDKAEEQEFEKFQKYIENEQTHSKCKASFFKHNDIWFMQFTPMP